MIVALLLIAVWPDMSLILPRIFLSYGSSCCQYQRTIHDHRVTGASSGIGLGCAVALAEQGAQVILAARSADKLAELRDAFRAKGFDAETLPLDVGDTTATAAAEHEPFDVLVNSAGIARHSPAAEREGDE